MPKTYKRMVLSPGLYNVNGKDGKRRPIELTEERLQHWADTVKQMNEKGLLIPAPYEHDLKAKPSSRREEFTNVGGFWKDAEFKDGKFTAYIEAATDEDEKVIGKKIRGLSIYTEPEYVDPTGQKWVDAPMHLALTNKPMALISGDDAEWEETDSFAICMSDMVGENPVEDVSSLLEKLKSVAKIALPENTSPQNLVANLMAALMQKELCEMEEEEGTTSKPPKDSSEESSPVLMSEEEMSKELEEQNRLLAEKNKALEDQLKTLQGTLLAQRKDGLVKRTEALLMSEVTKPAAEKIKSSLGSDGANLDLVEGQISVLESIPKPAPAKKDAASVLMSDASTVDGTVIDNPLHDTADISDERQEAILQEILQNAN